MGYFYHKEVRIVKIGNTEKFSGKLTSLNLNSRLSANSTRQSVSRTNSVNSVGEHVEPEVTTDSSPREQLPEGIDPDEAKYFSKGNRVEVYWNSDAIARELELISRAKKYIRVERYEFESMYPALLLAKKAKEGVKVQVIVDPNSSNWDQMKWECKKYVIDFLKKAGVDVKFFPLTEINSQQAKTQILKDLSQSWDQTKEYQIDHAKILLVDGEVAFLTGNNYGINSPRNRDVGVEIRGPAVAHIERDFRWSWLISGGESYDLPPAPPEQGNSWISIIKSDLRIEDDSYRANFYRNLREAKKRIYISAFVLSDPYAIKLLKEAKERGVDVKVILDPNKYGDSDGPNLETMKKLREAGIEAKWYKAHGNKLHMKVAIFDDNEVIVGSGNFSYRGLRINRELGANIVDKEIAKEFTDEFMKIWNQETTVEYPLQGDQHSEDIPYR